MPLVQIRKTQTNRLYQCIFTVPVNGLVVDLPSWSRPMQISLALPTEIYRFYYQPTRYLHLHLVSSFWQSIYIVHIHIYTFMHTYIHTYIEKILQILFPLNKKVGVSVYTIERDSDGLRCLRWVLIGLWSPRLG